MTVLNILGTFSGEECLHIHKAVLNEMKLGTSLHPSR